MSRLLGFQMGPVTVCQAAAGVLPLTPLSPRNQVLGAWAWLVPLAVALSTFGSAHGTFFSGSRVCYVAAREGHMVSEAVWEGLRAKLFPAGSLAGSPKQDLPSRHSPLPLRMGLRASASELQSLYFRLWRVTVLGHRSGATVYPPATPLGPSRTLC